jgi:hypothetical protein
MIWSTNKLKSTAALPYFTAQRLDVYHGGQSIAAIPPRRLMHWLTKLVHWGVHHQQEIQSIAPLATMISAICAAVGILVAVFTLIRTNKQLSLARQSLEATTIYNMQKDGRELI